MQGSAGSRDLLISFALLPNIETYLEMSVILYASVLDTLSGTPWTYLALQSEHVCGKGLEAPLKTLSKSGGTVRVRDQVGGLFATISGALRARRRRRRRRGIVGYLA
jgi:hypothetical protein